MDAEPQLLDEALERRVLALWGSKLGADADALDQDGLVVLSDHRDFAADRRATLRTARGTLLLAAPAEGLVAASDPRAYVSDVADRAQGIGLLFYSAAGCIGKRDTRTRVLGEADRPLLDALQHAAGDAETEDADVDVIIRSRSGSLRTAGFSRLRHCSTRVSLRSTWASSLRQRRGTVGSEQRSSRTSPVGRRSADDACSTAATWKTRRRPNPPAGAGSPSGASSRSPRRSSLRLVSLLPRSLQRSARLALSCT
jgi:hypothetical protein